jgi:hypothetical protein
MRDTFMTINAAGRVVAGMDPVEDISNGHLNHCFDYLRQVGLHAPILGEASAKFVCTTAPGPEVPLSLPLADLVHHSAFFPQLVLINLACCRPSCAQATQPSTVIHSMTRAPVWYMA